MNQKISTETFPPSLTVAFVEQAGGVTVYVETRSGPPQIIFNAATDFQPGDGYRWYRAFSLAFAAALGWSPALRDGLGVKRRSCRRTEKGEDGVRAQMIEEYLIANLFLDTQWLEGGSMPSGELIEEMQNASSGLEVADRSAEDWQRALLLGRQIYSFLRSAGDSILEVRLGQAAFDAYPIRSSYQKQAPVAGMAEAVPTFSSDECLEFYLAETKPSVVGLFRTLPKGGVVNTGSKAEEWSLNPADGFRWHDVFHLVNLARLGWSPVALSVLDSAPPAANLLRFELLEELIIARAYTALVNSQDILHVAGMARRLCLAQAKVDISEERWAAAFEESWKIIGLAKQSQGGFVTVDCPNRSIAFSPGHTVTVRPH